MTYELIIPRINDLLFSLLQIKYNEDAVHIIHVYCLFTIITRASASWDVRSMNNNLYQINYYFCGSLCLLSAAIC